MRILGLNPSSKHSKNVARDLLLGCWCKGKRIAGVQFPPLPLIYTATALKDVGCDVDVLDAQAESKKLEDIILIISDYDIVFLISATMSYAEDVSILEELKKANPNLITIIFGAHPTFLPEQALKSKSVDIIVRNESEFCIRDLILALEKEDGSWKAER